jgi:hypothetical protein
MIKGAYSKEEQRGRAKDKVKTIRKKHNITIE